MPRPSRFIVGQKFGRLVAVQLTADRKALYLCDCGKTTECLTGHVLRGRTQSCGCLRQEKIKLKGNPNKIKHGKSGTAIYAVWSSMISRCHNPNHLAFKSYGARGIEVCTEWRKFENFYADMSEPLKGMTLDRCNNNMGYSKANCRWVTSKAQGNNRRSNIIVTFNGESLNVTQWAEKLNMPRTIIYDRLRAGWSANRTLTDPVITKKRLTS